VDNDNEVAHPESESKVNYDEENSKLAPHGEQQEESSTENAQHSNECRCGLEVDLDSLTLSDTQRQPRE